jgi:hypothetical protein
MAYRPEILTRPAAATSEEQTSPREPVRGRDAEAFGVVMQRDTGFE